MVYSFSWKLVFEMNLGLFFRAEDGSSAAAMPSGTQKKGRSS